MHCTSTVHDYVGFSAPAIRKLNSLHKRAIRLAGASSRLPSRLMAKERMPRANGPSSSPAILKQHIYLHAAHMTHLLAKAADMAVFVRF